MRFIPDWFSDMALGMAVLYFPITFAAFYFYGVPPLIVLESNRALESVVSTLIVAVGGGVSYALGALVFGWMLNAVKAVYRRLLSIAR